MVIDTETTGLRPEAGDEIISLGAVKVMDRHIRIDESFDEIAHPGRAIPAASTRISMKFIAGDPMKLATKRLRGRR